MTGAHQRRWPARLALVVVLGLMAAAVPPVWAAPRPKGPYLGQRPPGGTAEPFAPGIVNVGVPTRDMTLTPTGDELFFTVFVSDFTRAAIVVSRQETQGWTLPEVAPFARDARFRTLEPCVSPDGRRLFFSSDRPEDPSAVRPGPFGLWVMDRGVSGWGEPRRLAAPVNGPAGTFFPSLTRDGTLYFTRDEEGGKSGIWRAHLEDGDYRHAERLPGAVNLGSDRFNGFVAPDESYMIVPAAGLDDSLGGTDYYVVFRRPDDAWSAPQPLGAAVNTPSGEEYSASLSPDGRYLFFMSTRGSALLPEAAGALTVEGLRQYQRGLASRVPGVYWIDASLIEDLRARAVFHETPAAAAR